MKSGMMADGANRASSRHVVLVGIGHTNAHVVRMWGMNPIPDADLTCISDYSVATYSGMLPAVLAGQIPKSAMEIDLVRLCASVGARLITNPIKSIDHQRREILFDDRPPVPFDAMSIGIGSQPTVSGIEIVGDSLIKIKPMQTFLDRLHALVSRLRETLPPARPLQVAVVGSGVAGIEILFCVERFLEEQFGEAFDLKLVTRSATKFFPLNRIACVPKSTQRLLVENTPFIQEAEWRESMTRAWSWLMDRA